MQKMVVSIQYLRGLAAMMVVLHHSISKTTELSPEFLIPYSGFGNAGVDIFFVISGFIMWVTTVSKTESPAYFWYRRVIRVVPLYWFFILVIVVPKLIIPEAYQSTQLNAAQILKSLLFIPHYHLVYNDQIWPILIPGWTLNYEMFFYFIFGACLFFRRSLRLPALIVTFICLITIGQWIVTENPLLSTYTDKILLEFLAGITIGVFYIRGITISAAVAYAVIFVSIVLFVGFEAAIFPGRIRIIMWGIPAILLVAATLCLETVSNIRQHKPLQMIGDASYSIYLSHIFTIQVIELLWKLLGWQTNTLAAQLMFVAQCVGASALVGILVFKMIEQPSLKLLRTWWRPTNTTVAIE